MMARTSNRAGNTAAANPSGLAAADLPASYAPKVAGYARGPFLDAAHVRSTEWRWNNCRTYVVTTPEGVDYRAVRVTDLHTSAEVGYWAVELLGTPLIVEEWEE